MPSVPVMTSTSPSQAGLGDRAAAVRAERAERRAPRRRARARRSGGRARRSRRAARRRRPCRTCRRWRSASRGRRTGAAPTRGARRRRGGRRRLGAGEPAAVDDRAVASSSCRTTSPRRASAGITPRLASAPEPNSSAARCPVKVASRSSSRRCSVIVPRADAGRARADAPAHRRVRGRLAHLRVVGEPERVARAQQQYRPPVEHHARALRSARPSACAGAARAG